MENYPDFGVGVDGYNPERADGTEVIRGENGKPWIYRSWDKTRRTFTIIHPALTSSQEQVLNDFYESNKSAEVLFYDPRSAQNYIVLMQGPPRIAGMRSGFHADIEMTLLEV